MKKSEQMIIMYEGECEQSTKGMALSVQAIDGIFVHNSKPVI